MSVHDLFADELVWGAIGFAIAAGLALRNLRGVALGAPLTLLAGTVGVYGGFWGSRLVAVLGANPSLFVHEPGFSLRFWLGMDSWLGGVIAGVALFALVVRLGGGRAGSAASAVVPALPLVHVAIQLGAFLRGDGLGTITDLPWAVHPAEVGAGVHPLPVYVLASELGAVPLLQAAWHRPALRASLLPAYLLLGSLLALGVNHLSASPTGIPLAIGPTTFQVIHAAVAFGAVVALPGVRRARPGMVAAGAGLAVAGAASVVVLPVSPPSAHAAGRRGTVLVLTRSALAEAASDLVRHRETQGHSVVVRRWERTPTRPELIEEVRAHVDDPLRAVLLVGDAGAPGEETADWHLPSLRTAEGKLSDMRYGDLDGDGRSDVPVGRLPVRDGRALRGLVHKLVVYEAAARPTSGFRLTMWAGAPGYEAPISAILHRVQAAKPRWLDFFGLCGAADSVFSGDVREQPRLFLRWLREPALVSMAVVHGSAQNMNAADHDGRPVFVGLSHVQALDSLTPLDPLLILACRSGTFDLPAAEGKSLSEAFLQHPGGPVAVVAASGDDGPLTNYLAVRSISRALEEGSVSTIGELLLHYQRELHQADGETVRRLDGGLGGVEAILASVGERRAKEFSSPETIREGVLRYNLLGDPLTPVRLPAALPVRVTSTREGLVASGRTPPGSDRLLVDFVDRSAELEPVPPDADAAERRRLLASANRVPRVLARHELAGESWTVGIPEPPACRFQDCYLRFRLLGSETSHYAIHALR